MAHHGDFWDVAPGHPTTTVLGPFTFTPKAVLFWTVGQDGFRGTGSMSLCWGLATPEYQSSITIGSDTIVGHLDCGSACVSDAPSYAGASGTPEAYNRQNVVEWDQCSNTISLDSFGSNWRTYYIALGGDTMHAHAGDLNLAGGGTTVTGLGFTPDFFVAIGARTAGASNARFYSGYATADLTQLSTTWAMTYFAEPGVVSQNSNLLDIWDLTSVVSGGFTVAGPGAVNAHGTYLAIADSAGEFAVGSVPWSSTSVSTGFRPQVVLGQSAVSDEETNAGTHTSRSMTAGYASDTYRDTDAARTAAVTGEAKNLTGTTPGDPFSGWGDSKLWCDSREDALVMSTLEDSSHAGVGSVSAFNAGGFSFSATAPGGTPLDFQYAAFRLSGADQTDNPCFEFRPRGALPILGVG